MKKMKNCLAVVAAVATMAAMATSVSAADWSQVSYADNDPNTGKIVSYDADGFEFANTDANADLCKARITLEKVLKNPKDFDKVRKLSWTVTYNNVSDKFTGEALSGGSYITCTNSTGYKIEPDEWDEANDKPVWKSTTYSVDDVCELPDDMTLVEDGELVFMDWSFSNIGDFGITVSISNFKMFDKDGNEIEQLGLNEFNAEAVSDVEEAEPVVDTEVKEDTTEVETTAEPVASDDTTKEDTTPKTGNSVVPVVFAAVAMLGAAGTMSKKSK